MSFSKAVAALLIAVFANPLCCCLSAFVSESQHLPNAASAAHACCYSEQENAEKDVSRHASQDCQHRLQEDSKISQHADSFDSIAKPLLFTLSFLDADFNLGASIESSASDTLVDRFAIPRDAPTPQAYCVYLL